MRVVIVTLFVALALLAWITDHTPTYQTPVPREYTCRVWIAEHNEYQEMKCPPRRQ